MLDDGMIPDCDTMEIQMRLNIILALRLGEGNVEENDGFKIISS
jgi:hypothetical protein